ncbi:CD226 antigen [Scleropages formosus]|uniref:CD226 antigen n=1 Tax=Scleropages formosus TaxID=113540 RepID=UPI00087837D9|nr:CD226 antigen [Scleropages formosus]
MDAAKRDYWYFVVHVILLAFLQGARLQKLADSTVMLEEGMTLDCVCPWEGNLTMISWTKMPEATSVAVYHPGRGQPVFKGYQGRVKFLQSSPMDGSISMSNVTDEDIGLYRCSITTFPEGTWSKDVHVKDPVSFGHHRVDIDVSIEKGGNFTLRCSHESNGTVYHVTFEKVEENRAQTVALCHREDGGHFVGVDGKDTAKVNCSSLLGLSLQLINVTEADSGVYRCVFDTGVIGPTVLLNVPEKGALGPTSLVIYMSIGAGIAGFLILLVAVTLVWWHRRKKRRAKVRAKLHPIQRRLLNNYEQADKTRKKTKHLEESPIYCNIVTQPRRTRKT